MSRITRTDSTVPDCEKSASSSFSVVLKERLPTYNLRPIASASCSPLIRNAAPVGQFRKPGPERESLDLTDTQDRSMTLVPGEGKQRAQLPEKPSVYQRTV